VHWTSLHALDIIVTEDDFLMIAHIFSQFPKDKHKAHITSEKKDLVSLEFEEMKKSVVAR
jgi:hypothetical protein